MRVANVDGWGRVALSISFVTNGPLRPTEAEGVDSWGIVELSTRVVSNGPLRPTETEGVGPEVGLIKSCLDEIVLFVVLLVRYGGITSVG